eukprot:767823-Hanusia_phi.AAC.3
MTVSRVSSLFVHREDSKSSWPGGAACKAGADRRCVQEALHCRGLIWKGSLPAAEAWLGQMRYQ